VTRFYVLALLAAGACAHHPEPVPPPAVTPQGAAALAVIPKDSTRGLLVVVTERHVPLLEQDLSALADTVWLWKSDTLYGGERRLWVLPDSYYVLLDLREIGGSGDTAHIFNAIVELCPGWPCHSDYRIRVRRDSTGFVPDWVRVLSIE